MWQASRNCHALVMRVPHLPQMENRLKMLEQQRGLNESHRS